VPLYLTDDLGDFKQVSVTVNLVQLAHTGSGAACDLLTDPESLDLSNLEGVLQLLDTTECPAQSYNRVNIRFAKAVGLMDSIGTSAECLFESYKYDGNPSQPNVLNCVDGTCSVSINGGINVIANTVNPFGLDFDLKNFEVDNFGSPNCGVSLKVEPQNNNDLNGKMAAGYKKGVTGYVSGFDIDGDSFTLTTRKGASFTVNYSQALYRSSPQPDLDGLLQFASEQNLLVRIITDNIDVSGQSVIVAETIYVKLEGRVSNLDLLNLLFTLENTTHGITVTVNYSDAAGYDKVEGNLADDIWVEVKLFGFDLDRYLAHEVEVKDEVVL